MTAVRLAVLGVAAFLLSHPTLALAGDCGEGPCPCVSNCGPPPPPPPPPVNLPPPVAIFGSGHADQRFDYYHDGVHQTQVDGNTYDYAVAPGRIGDIDPSGGSNTGTNSANVSTYPDALVEVGATNGIVGVNLLYSVVLHAPDAAAVARVSSLLNTNGAIAKVSGYSLLAAIPFGLGGYADDFVTTGAGLFGDQEAYVPTGLYGNVGGYSGLSARTSFDCDFRTYGSQHFGTAGCNRHDFTLPVNFVSATSFVGGSSLDFIRNVELTAAATSIQAAQVDSILDPTVSFSSAFNGQGFTLTVGGGQVANGSVPEPAGWALMLLGFTALGAGLRRRRSVVARSSLA